LAIAVVLALDVTNYLVLSYLPNFLSATLGYDTTHSPLLAVVTMLVMLVAIPFVGRLADRVGRRPVLAAACLGCIVLLVAAAAWQRVSDPCRSPAPGAVPDPVHRHHPVGAAGDVPDVAPPLRDGPGLQRRGVTIRRDRAHGRRVPRALNREPIHARVLHDGRRLIGLIAVWIMRETARQPLQSPPTIGEADAAGGGLLPG
jgi:hypothetical protein